MKRMVIGVGNLYRRDDGAGIAVVRRLRASASQVSIVMEHDGEPAGLLDAWEGADVAYVVDAVRGPSPGRVHRLEIRSNQGTHVPSGNARESSHTLGLGDAVELGRVLGRLPRQLILLGIEGTDFSAGQGLSDEVNRTTIAIAAELAGELA